MDGMSTGSLKIVKHLLCSPRCEGCTLSRAPGDLLRSLIGMRPIYLPTGSSKRSEVKVDVVTSADDHFWCIDFPMNETIRGACHSFEDSSSPWALVSRIFVSQGFSGTGTLIGHRRVLAGRNVAPWNDSSRCMRFVPAHFNGSSDHPCMVRGEEFYASDARGYDLHGDVVGYYAAFLQDWLPCPRSPSAISLPQASF